MQATKFIIEASIEVSKRLPIGPISDQTTRKHIHDVTRTLKCTRRAGKGLSINSILELAIDRLTVEDPEERASDTKFSLALDGVRLIGGPNFIRSRTGIIRSILRSGYIGFVVVAVLLPAFLVGVDVLMAKLWMSNADEGGQLTNSIGRCVAVPVDIELPQLIFIGRVGSEALLVYMCIHIISFACIREKGGNVLVKGSCMRTCKTGG